MKDNNTISQERLEIIERYLKNLMDADERTGFEQQVENDAVLKQQVADTDVIFSGIKKAVIIDKLDGFHKNLAEKKDVEKKTPKVFKLNFRILSIAASILILFGGFWYFNQRPNNDKLFDQYFEPDRGLATTMSETDNYDFNDAMVDYKNQKYDLAIQKWGLLLKSKPENDTLNYFLGIAQLANKNENRAIVYLQKVIELKKSGFADDAYYYIGLAYLKADETELAIENLEKSSSPKSDEIISELSD